MKKAYYIPALVIGAVNEARARDPRIGSRKPPLYAAYIHLLQTGLLRFLSEPDFETAVLTNWLKVDERDTDLWQRVRLPLADELHTAIKAGAEVADYRLYDFAHCLLIEAAKGFDYSTLKNRNDAK